MVPGELSLSKGRKAWRLVSHPTTTTTTLSVFTLSIVTLILSYTLQSLNPNLSHFVIIHLLFHPSPNHRRQKTLALPLHSKPHLNNPNPPIPLIQIQIPIPALHSSIRYLLQPLLFGTISTHSYYFELSVSIFPSLIWRAVILFLFLFSIFPGLIWRVVILFLFLFYIHRKRLKFDELGWDILSIALPAALALAADPITSLVDIAFLGHLGIPLFILLLLLLGVHMIGILNVITIYTRVVSMLDCESALFMYKFQYIESYL